MGREENISENREDKKLKNQLYDSRVNYEDVAVIFNPTWEWMKTERIALTFNTPAPGSQVVRWQQIMLLIPATNTFLGHVH